jgi:predicted ribosomally synthesized peptide with SipW-like signal peptide
MQNQFTISRRKVLAGLGTIGIASAGAGLGTTAFFSDEESLDASLEAGKIDLKLDYRATYVPWDRETAFDNVGVMDGSDGMTYVLSQVPDLRTEDTDVPVDEGTWGTTVVEDYGCDDDTSALVDGDAGVMFNLVDVKPKDEGEFTVSMHICDNRAYLWAKADKTDDSDNGVVEPEASANDAFDPEAEEQSDGVEGGELDDYMYVRVFFDENCDNVYEEGVEQESSGDVVIYEGSLAGFLDVAADGIALDDVFEDRDGESEDGTEADGGVGCYDPGVHCLAVYWYLPCFNVQSGDGNDLGFSQLDSSLPGSGEFAGTLAGELDAKGLPYMDFDAINMVQTDSVAWTLQFYAIQCRHNMTNDNPFNQTAPEPVGDGDLQTQT